MDSREIQSAVVVFASARAAGRRIAGVPAVARIVRELSEAGFATAWIDLPAGAPIDDDVARLAGSMEVRFGRPEAPTLELSGSRLVSASALRALATGESAPLDDALDLTRRDAAARILRQTGKASDGPVSRWLNRPVSRRLSALLLHIPGVRPVHATAGTALLALTMFAALVLGGPLGAIAGGLLFHAASIFDGVDGEVARATFRSSPAGAALDSAVDTATTLLFVAGLAINLGEHAFVVAGWGLGLFLLGIALLARRAARAGATLNLDSLKRHYRHRFSGSRLMAFFTVVSSRDFFALLFALLILAGLPMAPLYIFAAAASVWILFVAGALLKPHGAARGAA